MNYTDPAFFLFFGITFRRHTAHACATPGPAASVNEPLKTHTHG